MDRLALLSGKFDRRLVRRSNNADFKPNGLWYSCGRAWLKWLAAEEPSWITKDRALYKLDIDMSQLLRITTVRMLDAFEATYRGPGASGQAGWTIDWGAVAESFMGIEICPYQYERRHTSLWYYGWDVASGCIWDPRAILGWTRVPL